MNARRHWRLDLFAVCVAAVAGLAAVALSVPSGPLRTLAVAPLVVVLPGYALVAALYPERRSAPAGDDLAASDAITAQRRSTAGLLPSVRLALSVAASLALVAAVAIVATALDAGFDPLVLATATTVVTLLFVAVALVRRVRLPAAERGGLPPLPDRSVFVPPADAGSRLGGETSSRASLAVGVVLAVAVVALVGSVGFAAVATHQPDGGFTEFYLVTENASGDYVDAGYPTNFTAGEPRTLTAAVGNREHEATSYTVVVTLQRMDRTPDGMRVAEETELRRLDARVGPNETAHLTHEVRPTLAGGRLRLVYLLYRGDAPANPSRDSAYRVAQLVVSVDDAGSQTGSGGSAR